MSSNDCAITITGTYAQAAVVATPRKPVINCDDDTAKVHALLVRRGTDTTAPVIAHLTGLPLKAIHNHLLRLRRAGFAEPVGNACWIAV